METMFPQFTVTKKMAGVRTFYQDALRAEIISVREEVIFFVLLKFYVLRRFSSHLFFSGFCLMPAMHSGKMYMMPSFSLSFSFLCFKLRLN